jgi:hypothetical protein
LLGRAVGLFSESTMLIGDATRTPDEIERALHSKLAAIVATVGDG